MSNQENQQDKLIQNDDDDNNNNEEEEKIKPMKIPHASPIKKPLQNLPYVSATFIDKPPPPSQPQPNINNTENNNNDNNNNNSINDNDQDMDLFGVNDQTELVVSNESSDSEDTDKVNQSLYSSSDESDSINNEYKSVADKFVKKKCLSTPPPILNPKPTQQFLIQSQSNAQYGTNHTIIQQKHKVVKTSSSLILKSGGQFQNSKFSKTSRPIRMWTIDHTVYKDSTAESWILLYQTARREILSLLQTYGQLNGVNFAHNFFDTCQRLFCAVADVNNSQQRKKFDFVMDGVPNDFRMIMNSFNKTEASDFSQFSKVTIPNVETKYTNWLCCVNCPPQIAAELKHFFKQGKEFKYYHCLQYMTNFCRTTYHEKRVFITSMLAYMLVKLCQIIILSETKNEESALFHLFSCTNEMFTDIIDNPMKEKMMLQENSSVAYVTNLTQNRTRKMHPSSKITHSNSFSSSTSNRTKKTPTQNRTRKPHKQQHLIGSTTDNRIKQNNPKLALKTNNNNMNAMEYLTNTNTNTNTNITSSGDCSNNSKEGGSCIVQ